MKKTYELRTTRENLRFKVEVNSSKNQTNLVDIHVFNARGEQVGRETFGVGDRFIHTVPHSSFITWRIITRISSNNVYFKFDFSPDRKEFPVPIPVFAGHNYRGFNMDRIEKYNAKYDKVVPNPPGYWDVPNHNFGADY